MSDSKISALPAAATLTGAELVPVVQAGNSVRSTVSAIGNNALGIYTAPGVGAVARTVSSKLSDAVSIEDFGADPTGAVDSTAAIQAALNSGVRAVFVPPGIFKFSALVMPTSQYFTFYGAGQASQLIQTGTGITWPSTGTNPPGYYNGSIHHMSFVSVGGTGDTINARYSGGLTLENLWFGNQPIGFSSIRIDGNPASTGDKYSHDVRIARCQMYTTTAGFAGIYLDQYSSDLQIDSWIMNASAIVPYCLYAANGAQSFNVSNSHPYGAKTNIIFLAAGATTALGVTFSNCVIDNVSSGLGDNVVLNNARTPLFANCWFEVVNAGRNALTLNNCIGTTLDNCRIDGNAGAGYIVVETGTSDFTEVLGGDSPTLSNFNNPPFNFIGAHSLTRNFVATTPWGIQTSLTGSTSAPVAANSTVYLGCNGAQAAIQNTAFMVSLNTGSYVLRADIAFDAAPGVGQTYTFTLVGNGATLVAAAGSANPVVVTGAGTFTASIIIAQGAGSFLVQFNQVAIKMVSSAAAGAPSLRYAIQVVG